LKPIRNVSFLIESKKIINVEGVHHEVDIFVTIDLGNDYKSIFIFECKNWQDTVRKNDVIVFTEKISAANARRLAQTRFLNSLCRLPAKFCAAM
jgi:hypothetical protein